MADKNSSPDIQDSPRDKERLQPDEARIDLPDVTDIPGQENIHVPNLREMADTTISSDDEEGVGVWDKEAPAEDLTNERLGPAQEIDQNDLRMNRNEKKLETKLDQEENSKETTPDELEITDDSVDPEFDVRPDEIEALERSENMDTKDNENLYRAELDNTDFEGEKLNEDIEVSGEDLDVPGAELDDDSEELGEEDEENNAYSLGDNE